DSPGSRGPQPAGARRPRRHRSGLDQRPGARHTPDSMTQPSRIAIVTGASRGIGRATAMRLAADGATVVCAARGDNAASTVQAIADAGGRAEVAALEVTDQASVDRLVVGVLERHG